MPGKADIQAGGAFIRLFLKDEMTSNLSKSLSQFTVVAGAGFAAATAAVHQFVSAASEINDMAARTGFGTTQLQHLKFAAGQTGASISDLEISAKKFVKGGGDIRNFEAVGKAIASIQDPSERARQALETFGKSGTNLLPMFRELNSLKAASAALGPVLTPAEVEAGDKLGDAFSAMKEAGSRLVQTIGGELSPAFQEMLQAAIAISAQFATWIKSEKAAGRTHIPKFVLADPKSPLGRLIAGKAAEGAKIVETVANANKAAENNKAVAAENEKVVAFSKQSELLNQILAAERERRALVDQFATPQERQLQKLMEFNDALIKVNQTRILGFITPEQAAAEKHALELARQRFLFEEQRKGMRPAGKPDAAAFAGPNVEFKSMSTTAAFGAMALANGAGKGQDRLVAEHVKDRALLLRQIMLQEEMLRKTGKQAIAT